ncbi:UDP-N-acetylmuramoyl-tripeptide--D-alanyl-D-alanine ligase [Subsaxibacter sp. CAU 1640]|uniref:UDP-N-acetylmuramoyl-tripeptide--D-alanyl-D- alanine ligase n=1 Tax=Subsaxibacter sp. CAU 1640 TaxID=2933271 RepID=UPI0020048293|nr:UDP-N-acetylmuramoyl-tripeptide--D-alanyl-D-alanine ligase [Subsaxibacter sp. CAU 1640]MCK7591845.1 UDP-N-acetylmuramoyl-tripeptide--D-alanyl-D-alanine ligase [Subsaxibacter sp. CAU 1640]
MDIEAIYSYYLKCSSVCTDTRKIQQGCLFFALKGDNFNGNTFAHQALEKGAKYCIIDEADYLTDNCILVDNVLKTLQLLATHHRNQLIVPIIALTGSNGKTTTKELINAVLSKKFNTTATLGNLNNHIGVPLTLLSMTDKTDIAIVEMGANHPKEIAFLCDIAQPDYGLITNFGKAHLEGFGSVEGVIKSKSELYDYLKKHQKTIFVNENDEIQVKQTLHYENIYHFGLITSLDAMVELISSQPYVSLKYNNKTINSQLTGMYNFNNIAVAIAVGSYFKVDSEDIVSAIENYNPTNNRSQLIEKGSNSIIMDAYNANPTSMMAALENFKQLHKDHKVLFLGDMFELGATSEIEHQQIVDYIKQNPFDETYIIGKNFFKTDVNGSNIKKFEGFDDLKDELQKRPIENKFMLIKGSRGMALERILQIL